jgi:hypothetical protein
MSLLDKLERALGRFAIPNLSLYLVIGQVFVLLAYLFEKLELRWILFYPAFVTEGQWWRVITFMFIPPFVPRPNDYLSLVFLAFAWSLFYTMGSALEHFWGTFRFNAFLFISYALTVGFAFLTPGSVVTNTFILLSVFLAFAYVNPDYELILFFILPVKVKWLALISWVTNVVMFIQGGLATRIQIGASVVAYSGVFWRRLAAPHPKQAADLRAPRAAGRGSGAAAACVFRVWQERHHAPSARFPLLLEVRRRSVLLPRAHSKPRARRRARWAEVDLIRSRRPARFAPLATG